MYVSVLRLHGIDIFVVVGKREDQMPQSLMHVSKNQRFTREAVDRLGDIWIVWPLEAK